MGESIERMLDGLRTFRLRGAWTRTAHPDPRFEDLPDFPWEPHYRDVDGLRMAHVEDGDGPPVVMFHGEPTWSFLWRKVLPPVRDAGHRVILPDLVGFGRSDKPTDFDWYSYDRHVEYATTLFEDLDLRDATVVVHDWGGPDRPAHRGREPGAGRAHRRHGHGPVHRPPADERRVEDVPRLRRAHGGPADLDARAQRVQDRSGRRGGGRLRRARSRSRARSRERARSR